jgi:hypothetical protein
MKRIATKLLTTMLAIGLTAGQAMSAMVCGVAQNAQGTPVSGATITVKDSSGKVLGQTTTGSNGQYEIGNLGTGTLDLFFDPGASGGQDGSGVLDLTGASKMVNWQTSNTSAALASQGGVCGAGALGWDEWAAIGVLGVTVLGGAAVLALGLDGYFDDHHHHHPVSPQF